MIEFQYIIRDPLGLHGRPSKQLVSLVKELDSCVTVFTPYASANGTSLLRLMSLGAVTGTTLTVRIEGGNEDISSKRLKAFFDMKL